MREAMEGCDAVVNFAAESHVDRSIDDQDAFARTHVIGTGTLLDAARELGVSRYLQVSTDEVYGSIESGSFTETSPLDPSSPYSATKAAGDLLVAAHVHTYGIDASIVPRLQQLRPAPVPGEADPADHPERPARRLAAGLWRRQAGPQLALRRGLLPRHPRGAGERQPGEAYNVGGPDECENIEVIKRVIELTGKDESLIEYVHDRPGHDRRYSLSSAKLSDSSAGRRRSTSPRDWRRPSPGIATTRTGGARSAPASTASTTKSSTARPWANAERLPTKLDGVVLLEPTVHGDERGFMVETYRRDLWAEHGVEVEFVQHNHSRSSKGTLRGLHFQTEPGQAKLVRCPRGKIFDVAVDLRRGSPTYGQWEAYELDDECHRQLFVPVGFGHGFAVLSEIADVTYLCSSTYDPATESGIAWDDPGVGVDWPVDDPLLSERDKTAPTLAEVGETLPF